MQRIADIPSSLIDVVRGIIIFTISAHFSFDGLREVYRKRQGTRKEGG